MLTLHAPDHLTEEGNALAAKHRELSGHLFATSGTTAAPKWILHSQDGLDWCADTVNSHFSCTPQDIWGLALPEFHVGGHCLTHRAKRAGGTLKRFEKKWSAAEFTPWLVREEVTITSLVPTQIFDLVQAKQTAPPSLRLALIGGDRLADTIYQKARSLGWPLVLSYGMTETAGLIACSSLADTTLRPLPGWQLTTTDSHLLTVSGPGLFQGYLTSDSFQKSSQLFATTDLVELRDDNLRILGRADDQIKILGELVDLAKLKSDLARAFPTTPSTIVTLLDPRRGHLLYPVFESIGDAQITTNFPAWNERRPPFARMQPPLFLSSWPRTALGKVDRRALAAQVANERDSLLPPR